MNMQVWFALVTMMGVWCGPAWGTSLSVGATTMGIIGPGSQGMIRGEMVMVEWEVGDSTELGFMVERFRLPGFGPVTPFLVTSLVLERTVMQQVRAGLSVGLVGGTGLAGAGLLIDLHGRVEILQVGGASLGVMLGWRSIAGGGALSNVLPFAGIPGTVRLALIGTGQL